MYTKQSYYRATIIEAAKLMLGDDNLELYFNKDGCMDYIIKEAMDNAKYLMNIPFLQRNRMRSYSGDFHIHYPTTQRSLSPMEEFMEIIENIELMYKHSPKKSGLNVYNRLNNDLTEIISRSSLEYDIYTAYMLKRFIKEAFINNDGANINYSHHQKLIIFAFIVNHVPFIRLALQRSKQSIYKGPVYFSSAMIRADDHIRQEGIISIIHGYLKPI